MSPEAVGLIPVDFSQADGAVVQSYSSNPLPFAPPARPELTTKPLDFMDAAADGDCLGVRDVTEQREVVHGPNL